MTVSLPYTASCSIDPDDTIQISADGDVGIIPSGGSLFLTPKKARKLAKALKLAARRVEGRA